MVERTDFVRADVAESREWTEVVSLANALTEHLRTPEVLARITDANQPGRSSAAMRGYPHSRPPNAGFAWEGGRKPLRSTPNTTPPTMR